MKKLIENTLRNWVPMKQEVHLRNLDLTAIHFRYFNVCSGALLPDIMHDLLEGALQYELKLMLQLFIFQEQYITL